MNTRILLPLALSISILACPSTAIAASGGRISSGGFRSPSLYSGGFRSGGSYRSSPSYSSPRIYRSPSVPRYSRPNVIIDSVPLPIPIPIFAPRPVIVAPVAPMAPVAPVAPFPQGSSQAPARFNFSPFIWGLFLLFVYRIGLYRIRRL